MQIKEILKKLKAAIIALLLGGSVYIGAEMGRPECDYVIITKQQEEICITAEQAEVLEDLEVGFGGIEFGGGINILIKKQL